MIISKEGALMISRNAVRMLGCGWLCLAGLFAFQKPFRQYPGRDEVIWTQAGRDSAAVREAAPA